jgi:hypothetical protein
MKYNENGNCFQYTGQMLPYSMKYWRLYVYYHKREYEYTLTYRLIARQRLGKQIPAEAGASNNKTSIAR